MSYSDEFLGQIKSFGVLSFSIDKIIHMLNPNEEEQLREDFKDPLSEVYKSYQKGRTTAAYSLDKALFDKATKTADTGSNILMGRRLHENKINDVINEKFGL